MLQVFNTSVFPFNQLVVERYFNAPVVSVAEALGSPKRRRISLEGVVKEVNIVILDSS